MGIRVLDDLVVNKIAAGEVIERPVSVIRELVDNAVDAGATEIDIILEEAGKLQIVISDNGCGMNRTDAELCFERHATSKIQQASDLDRISTMGFRGEALSSIASVSHVMLTTRPASEDLATQITIEGGVCREVREVASRPGTTFQISHLFFNVPARKKFLKSDRAELTRIKNWVMGTSLGAPHIQFRITSNGKRILFLPAAETTAQRGEELYQGGYTSFFEEYGDATFTGRIGHPSLALTSSTQLVVLVNNRVVSDRTVLRAVREGYDSMLKGKEYPVGYLSLDIPPSDVDVNVHPQKSEVRFRDSNKIFEMVRDGVYQAVKSFRAAVPSGSSATGGVSQERRYQDTHPYFQSTYRASTSEFSPVRESTVVWSSGNVAYQPQLGESPQEVTQTVAESREVKLSDLRYIGQVLDCYLLCEGEDMMYVVDMHAAHERYNFNLVRNRFQTENMSSQQLLVPLTLNLPEENLERCLTHVDVLKRFGFELERFGDETLLIRAIPTVLEGKDVTLLMKELSELEEGAEQGVEEAVEALRDEVAARIACHASIRSGKKMQKEEVYALFADLDKSEFKTACPHGRPITVSFDEFQIEKWFGRDR